MGSSALVIEGMHDLATLEVIASREALALAADLNINNLVVASDSKQAVNDINNEAMGTSGAIIGEIKSRALLFNCNFTFESRAANYEAHALAKFSRRLQQGRHVWFDQPHDQHCIPLSVAFDE